MTDQERGGKPQSFEPLRQARAIGYTQEQLESVPTNAIMGFGCANPVIYAELRPGETVLDLGCGGGLDLLLAAREVGPEGQVIGVDFDEAMVELARANAHAAKLGNVRVEAAEMEHLPLASACVDVVISNCAISYSDDIEAVFRQVHRVLRRGGRMVVADLVLDEPLGAEELRLAPEAWREWLDAAADTSHYLRAIERAGLRQIELLEERLFNLAEATELLRGRVTSLVVRALR
ncbi:MAG: methyltransferase domain-containing protein [Armatimonadota bacterium]